MYETNYHRASSIDEAVALFAKGKEAKFLAGGQTLLPVMKQRLAAPSDVIDLAKVKELVERGADVKFRAKSGQTALTVAATYKGAAPVMRQLIAKGADAVPVKDTEFNSNPLVYATSASVSNSPARN